MSDLRNITISIVQLFHANQPNPHTIVITASTRKKRNENGWLSEMLVDKVVWQNPVCCSSLAVVKLLCFIVTSGTLCTIPSAPSDCLKINLWCALCTTKNEALLMPDKRRARIKILEVCDDVIFTVKLYCSLCYWLYHVVIAGRTKPTKISTNRHMSDEFPKLSNRHNLIFSTSSSLSIPDFSFRLECCQDSLRGEEVENRKDSDQSLISLRSIGISILI